MAFLCFNDKNNYEDMYSLRVPIILVHGPIKT